MMDKINLDRILDIVNEEKIEKGLENYVPCYPMLRRENNKLYIGVLLTDIKDNVWDINESIKGEYWCLIDIETLEIVEFNETSKKDYVVGELIGKNIENGQKELSKYEVTKNIEYTNYLLNDIKNDNLPIQKKLSNILNNEIDVDGEKVSINEYIMANIEDDIKKKVKELVDLVIQTKYSSITFYYDELFNKVIKEYKESDNVNKELIEHCIEIMNNYYYGIIGISNFFNI